MNAKRDRGFTLIEVLVVVAIVGVLSAIAIFNYHSAIQRARQKRTMADIKTIATAWESRAVDVKAYNAAGFTVPAQPVGFTTLGPMLAPTYVKVIPARDAWQQPFDFATDWAVGSGTAANEYVIRSAGRDAKFSGKSYAGGETTDYDCDIVYANGKFIQWPEGTQH